MFDDVNERYADIIAELDALSKAVAAGWTAMGGWPKAEGTSMPPCVMKSPPVRPPSAKPKPKATARPAPRRETRAEKLVRLHARVRSALPEVMSKAMADFSAGRITAVDVSRIEAQLNRMREIVS